MKNSADGLRRWGTVVQSGSAGLVWAVCASALALSACATKTAQRTPVDNGPPCGNGVLDPGELCDPGMSLAQGRCSSTCDSLCGNSVVEGAEACDDGNNWNGDGCSYDCKSFCGNHIVESGEECDDGNDVAGDGCYKCHKPGAALWTVQDDCGGPLVQVDDKTFRAMCQGLLYRTYSFDGSPAKDGPPALNDPNESSVAVSTMVMAPNGDAYFAAQAVRNNTPAGMQPRTRIYRVNAAGAELWHRDLTAFPGGPYETPRALVPLGGGVLVGGMSSNAPGQAGYVQRAFMALVGADGTLLWKRLATEQEDLVALGVGRDGTVYGAGATRHYTAAAVWAVGGTDSVDRWTWTDTPGIAGGATQVAIDDGGVHVLTFQATSDDLVPTPPRVTQTWTLQTMDAAAGTAAPHLLSTSQTNGMPYGAANYPTAVLTGASPTIYLESGLDGTHGFAADNSELWTIPTLGTTSATAGSSIGGTLVHGPLLCMTFRSYSSPDAFHTNVTPGIGCYVIQ